MILKNQLIENTTKGFACSLCDEVQRFIHGWGSKNKIKTPSVFRVIFYKLKYLQLNKKNEYSKIT
jgi:hypothetical protein